MGKFQRYFSANDDKGNKPSPGGNVPKGNVLNKTKKLPGKLKIKTIVASDKPRKWNISKRHGKPGKFHPKRERKNPSNPKWKSKSKKDEKDPFPNVAPVSKHSLKKFSRGKGLTAAGKKKIKTNVRRKKIIQKDKKIASGLEQAARADLLLVEESGGIEVEDWESTLQLKQCDIAKHVDLASATKKFELNLNQFGPYKHDYSLNGRHLVLGGKKGHIAAFDWVTKRLLCEVSVKESVHDVKWLHNETLFAVAQKEWTYIYDNQGIEVHCLKKLDRVYDLDFLPYHFLLVAGHQSGYLSWVDVSIGKIVAQYRTKLGPAPSVLTTNPANAVTFCGHSNGVVSLWAPSLKEPLASVLCHSSSVSAVAVDSTGRLMATGGQDGTLRLWDLRNSYVPLTSSKIGIASCLNFSQRGLMSMSTANQTLIFSEVGQRQKPYLKHVSHSNVSSLKFCPFEDVLGIGTNDGFQSILIPGAGEANFDALERNPFQTKNQRKEWEVKALLEKIQPELITLDNSLLGEVDTETLKQDLDSKPKYLKKADLELSHRKKRKSAKIPKIKQGLQSELNIKQAKTAQQLTKQEERTAPQQKKVPQVFDDPLDRFKTKKKK